MTLNEYLVSLLILAWIWYCGYLVWPDLPEKVHEWMRRRV